MSQAGIISTSSGPVPPTVPTQFTADDGTIAIPSGNNLYVLGFESSDNNLNGIQTEAIPDNGDNLYVLLTNRVSGFVDTINDTPATLLTFTTPGNIGIYDIEIRIVVFDATDTIGGTYYIDASAQTDGVNVVSIGTPTIEYDGDPTYSASQVEITTSGVDIDVIVTGFAAKSARWRGLLTFVFGGV